MTAEAAFAAASSAGHGFSPACRAVFGRTHEAAWLLPAWLLPPYCTVRKCERYFLLNNKAVNRLEQQLLSTAPQAPVDRSR